MARFASDSRLVQAICDGVEQLHQRHANRRQFDGHDLINWLDAKHNRELNDVYDKYDDCKDPEMTADQQIGKFLYRLGQVKIGDRVSQRRISRRGGYHRNGKCTVSVWEISKQTIDALAQAKQGLLGDEETEPALLVTWS